MKKPINEIERLKLIAGLINEINYNDSVYGVKRTTLTEGKKKKEVKELSIDVANPYEYRMGLQYELEQMDDYSNESLEKAKSIVLKNLAKDVNFYTTLLNQDQSPYKFEAPETDKPGMQAKADGYLKKELKKDAKANVQDSLGKKEEGSKKPKGVKVMPDKGVTGSEKTIKEGAGDKVEDMIKSGKIKPEEVKAAAEKAMKGDSTSLIALMAGLPGISLSEDTVEEDLKKGDTIEYEGNKYMIGDFDTAGGANLVYLNTMNNKPAEDSKGRYKKVHKSRVKKINEDLEEGKANKYISVEIEGDEQFPILNKVLVSDYLKSVIDPEEIESVDVFMDDEEGFDESSSYFFDTDEENASEKDVEDWAKQEMSYYLFSKPDEFPGKGDIMEADASDDLNPNELSNENTFEDLMKKYDWYYEMGDDPRAYDRGTALDKQLKSLAKSIGIDRAVELFNQYAPSDRKVTTSFFQMNEDKHAKLKELLKTKIKEVISAAELIQAKQKGQIVKIPKSATTDIQSAERAKANYSIYE
jgi:hypothetical protein